MKLNGDGAAMDTGKKVDTIQQLAWQTLSPGQKEEIGMKIVGKIKTKPAP
jgi:hypothetical protein